MIAQAVLNIVWNIISISHAITYNNSFLLCTNACSYCKFCLMKYFLNRSYDEINIRVRGKSQIYVMLVQFKESFNSLKDIFALHSIRFQFKMTKILIINCSYGGFFFFRETNFTHIIRSPAETMNPFQVVVISRSRRNV